MSDFELQILALAQAGVWAVVIVGVVVVFSLGILVVKAMR